MKTGDRVALTIDTEARPHHVLSIRGVAEVAQVEGVVDEYARAAERYLGKEAGADYIKALPPKLGMSRIAVRPDELWCWTSSPGSRARSPPWVWPNGVDQRTAYGFAQRLTAGGWSIPPVWATSLVGDKVTPAALPPLISFPMNLLAEDHNTTRVVAARFISRAGGEAAFFVGIWGKAAYEFGATPGQQALLMGSMGIFFLVGSALAGVMIDRYDPRRVLMLSELVFVPATLALVVPNSIGQMTLTIVFAATATGAVMTSVAALPPFLTDDPARLQRINAAVEAAASAAFVAGPALGALIARYWTLDWIFVLDAATSIVAVALVARVTLRAGSQREGQLAAFKEMRDGFAYAWTSRPLRLYLGVFAALWLSFGAFGALEPLFYRDILGTGPEALGWVNTVFGGGVVAGSVILGRLPQRYVCARAALVGAIASGLGAVLYTGTSDIRVVVAGAVYWGIVLGVMFPMVRTLIQLATPDHLVGRVMGTTNVSSQVGELLPLTFVPALAASLGIQPVLVGSGVCLIVFALFVYREGARIDSIRAREQIDIAPLDAQEPISPHS